MKYTIILFTILFATSIHHHSYTGETTINCVDGTNNLLQDYKDYLIQQIDLYKTEPITVSSLITMGEIITGSNKPGYLIHTQNHEGNTFLHIAVTKKDLPVIEDIFSGSGRMYTNTQGKTPLDLAIEQLNPKSFKSSRKIAILETIAHRIAIAYPSTSKIECLQKMITLELACKDRIAPFAFIPNTDLLQKLIPAEHKINSEQFLDNLYKQTINNETGDTFAHVCVNQENPDELFKLVCMDRISDAKNKEGLDPLALALRAFRTFTTKTELINENRDKFNRVRCCYFILYYYFTENSTNSCCEKHKRPSQ